MIVQNEGVNYGREIWPTLNLKYQGNKRGRFTTNIIAGTFDWNKGEEISGNLIPLFVDIARLMKAHQATLRQNGVTPEKYSFQKNDFVYKTPEMLMLNDYIRKATDSLTDRYFERNKDIFRTSPENDIKVLNKQVKTEYMNILNMAVNVVAMLSHTDETACLGYKK